MKQGNAGRRLAITVVVLVLSTRRGQAQIPEQFTNLRVLPKDMPRKELVRTMRGWTGALGVRCGHCHTGGNPETLEGVDFASDAKWEKRTARQMLRMVRALDSDYVQRLEARPATGGPPVAAVPPVGCVTCHRGLARPETIDAVLERILAAEGPAAAVRTYKELRSKYLGRGSYDFGEGPVNMLAERLIGEKRAPEAALLLEMSAEYNPDAAWVQHLLGEARLATGDRARALTTFEHALALNPQNELTRKRVDELSPLAALEPPREGTFLLAVEPNHSTVGFAVPIAGGMTRVTGKFKDFAGQIVMNEQDLSRCSVEITIKATSVDTGIDERDAHLREPIFFDVVAHPLITFKSTRIEKTPDGYLAFGTLTIRGVSREIRLPFRKTGLEWAEGRPFLGIAGEIKLSRSEFGVGTDWRHSAMPNFLGDEVAVELFVWTKLGRHAEEGVDPGPPRP